MDYTAMIEKLRPFLTASATSVYNSGRDHPWMMQGTQQRLEDEKYRPMPSRNPVQDRWPDPKQLPGERTMDRGGFPVIL